MSHTGRLLTLSCIVMMIVSGAFAGTIRDDQSQQSYLDLGASAKYASVGRLDFSTATGNYIGSGTLISPNWILTAAHCVAGDTKMTVTLGGQQYSADKFVVASGWNGNLGAGNDIGLVHLSAPVANVAPAQRYTGTSELGKTVTYVGYGMTGTGKTGAVTFDGQKRAGQNVVDSYYSGNSKTARILLSDFDSPTKSRANNSMGSSTPLKLEYSIAPGDSGGGVFIDSGAGTYLAGVNSFGMAYDGKVDSDYGDISGATRVSIFNTWIDGVLASTLTSLTKTLATIGGTAFDFDASGVPEPMTITLLSLGALALMNRRRNSRA